MLFLILVGIGSLLAIFLPSADLFGQLYSHPPPLLFLHHFKLFFIVQLQKSPPKNIFSRFIFLVQVAGHFPLDALSSA